MCGDVMHADSAVKPFFCCHDPVSHPLSSLARAELGGRDGHGPIFAGVAFMCGVLCHLLPTRVRTTESDPPSHTTPHRTHTLQEKKRWTSWAYANFGVETRIHTDSADSVMHLQKGSGERERDWELRSNSPRKRNPGRDTRVSMRPVLFRSKM